MRLDDPKLDLAALLSAPLRDDDTGIALAESVTPALRGFLGAIRNVALLSNVQNLPEAILDELARDLNVPWYDMGADVAVKREAIRTSDRINRRLGTPWAVAAVAEMYFGRSKVEEWWAYEGEPYHFRVTTANLDAVTVHSAIFREMIQRTKNARSVFDGVTVHPDIPPHTAFAGLAVQTVRRMTVHIGA